MILPMTRGRFCGCLVACGIAAGTAFACSDSANVAVVDGGDDSNTTSDAAGSDAAGDVITRDAKTTDAGNEGAAPVDAGPPFYTVSKEGQVQTVVSFDGKPNPSPPASVEVQARFTHDEFNEAGAPYDTITIHVPPNASGTLPCDALNNVIYIDRYDVANPYVCTTDALGKACSIQITRLDPPGGFVDGSFDCAVSRTTFNSGTYIPFRLAFHVPRMP